MRKTYNNGTPTHKLLENDVGNLPTSNLPTINEFGWSCGHFNLGQDPCKVTQILQSVINFGHPLGSLLANQLNLFGQTSMFNTLNSQHHGAGNKKSFIKIRDFVQPKAFSMDEAISGECHLASVKRPTPSMDAVSHSSSNVSRSSKHEETKISSQNGKSRNASICSPHSVSRASDLGDTEKTDYIKAIFEVIKIDKKSNKQVKLTKHRHIISHWPHTTAQYYAKGMCKKCYFSRGQLKKLATRCEHKTSPHYATGMCKLCYLKNYHKTHERKRSRKH